MLCVSLGKVTFEECLDAVKKHELCELRLDRLKLKDSELKRIFAAGKKIIATYRPKDAGDIECMKKLIAAIDMGADYIDINVEASDEVKDEILAYAKKKKCKVIVSYHNYKKTPLEEELKHIVEWCKTSSPDIIKIACHSHSDRDNARLLGLLDSDDKMVVIGMGAKGKITRVMAPKLGALFTYVTLSKKSKTAPGQFTKDEMDKILGGLHYV